MTTPSSAGVTPPSGPPRCWRPARWPVSRATTRGPRTWPARASSCAPRGATTAACRWRTASSAKRRSPWETTTRPSRISSVSWPRRRKPVTRSGRPTPAICSARPPATAVSSAAPGRCCGRRRSCSARPAIPAGASVMLSSLGEVARDAGQPRQAWRLYGAALRRHAALGDKRHMAYELEGLASAAGMGRRPPGSGVPRGGPGAPGGDRRPAAPGRAGHPGPDPRARLWLRCRRGTARMRSTRDGTSQLPATIANALTVVGPERPSR